MSHGKERDQASSGWRPEERVRPAERRLDPAYLRVARTAFASSAPEKAALRVKALLSAFGFPFRREGNQ